jgi:hypothetical protein
MMNMKTLSGTGCSLMLAIVYGAGCAAEEPRGFEIEHHAGEAADRTPELHTGMIATAAGPLEITYEVIDSHVVLEGDMIIPWSDLLDPHVAHAATVPRSSTWPGGVVPFEVDPALPDQGRVINAINHWQQSTGIRFVGRTTQTDYVRFTVGGGCSSYVGRIGGRQEVFLAAGCSTGNTIHEIGHAIGLWHEQSRQDRDNHVIVHWGNIIAGYGNNFNKYGSGMDVGAYDLGSIMHYPSWAFSANGQSTITTLDGGQIEGQRNGLSSGDRLGANVLYSTPSTGDDMLRSEMLAPGQAISSNDGRFRFVYQTDGNLVLYRNSNGAALWASNTWNTAPGACLMQHDGNLVIYNASGVPIWASHTWGYLGHRLVVQNDGNVVIYNGAGSPVWATNTMQ